MCYSQAAEAADQKAQADKQAQVRCHSERSSFTTHSAVKDDHLSFSQAEAKAAAEKAAADKAAFDKKVCAFNKNIIANHFS